jgi:hypothetical protein
MVLIMKWPRDIVLFVSLKTDGDVGAVADRLMFLLR